MGCLEPGEETRVGERGSGPEWERWDEEQHQAVRGDRLWPGRDRGARSRSRGKLGSVGISSGIAAAVPQASVGPVVLLEGNGASSCSVEREIIPFPGELGPSWSGAGAAASIAWIPGVLKGKQSAWSGKWNCLGLTGVLRGAGNLRCDEIWCQFSLTQR